jgi:hypothetical protein
VDPIAIYLAILFLIGLGMAVLKIALRRRRLRDHPEADVELSPFGGILAGVWLATSIAMVAVGKMHPESEFGRWMTSPWMMELFIFGAVGSLFIVGATLQTVGIAIVTPRKVRDV